MNEDSAAPERPFAQGDTSPSANLGSEPVRRAKRGRPSNAELAARSVNGATPIPESIATPKNKPGRKPKKATLSDEQKSALGKQVCGLHIIASMTFGIPELVIQPQEGEMLATALIAVADEYGLALAGKTGAAIQLLGTGAMIYLPRYFAMQKRISTGNIPQTQEPAPNGDAIPTVN